MGDLLYRGSRWMICHWFRRRERLCTCTSCLFVFYRTLLRGNCNLGLHLFRLRLFCSGSHLGQLGCLSDWLGVGLGMEEGALALTTRPPQTTWLQTSNRSICSAEGPARLALGHAGWLVAAILRRRAGACFARAALASFHFPQPQ